MLILPRLFVTVIGASAPMFSKRVFEHVKLLIVGALLAPGTRTVTSVLGVIGQSDDRHFQHDHRVLSRARWSALCGGRILLRWLLRAFVPTGPVGLGIDATSARRRGATIAATEISRDPVRSSPTHFVKASGWRWVSLMLLAPIPWTTRVWGLPFLTALSPAARYYQLPTALSVTIQWTHHHNLSSSATTVCPAPGRIWEMETGVSRIQPQDDLFWRVSKFSGKKSSVVEEKSMQTNFMLISSVIIAYLSVYHRQPSTSQISSTLDAPGAAVVLSVTALLVADLP